MPTDDHNFLTTIIIVVITSVAASALLWINHLIFRQIQKKKKDIQTTFLKRVIGAAIVVVALIIIATALIGGENGWKTILGGTAVITAVVGFAAQGVIKDWLGGLMISIHKPFEIGDRITLEDGTTGAVTNITMRHVVLAGLDTDIHVIPNSKLNTMKVTNFSYNRENMSARLNFYAAFNADMEKALKIVKDAIVASPYTIPGKPGASEGDEPTYADVYFTGYEDWRFGMNTTIYYPRDVSTSVVRTDIYVRVSKALKENGMEPPYPYIKVENNRG